MEWSTTISLCKLSTFNIINPLSNYQLSILYYQIINVNGHHLSYQYISTLHLRRFFANVNGWMNRIRPIYRMVLGIDTFFRYPYFSGFDIKFKYRYFLIPDHDSHFKKQYFTIPISGIDIQVSIPQFDTFRYFEIWTENFCIANYYLLIKINQDSSMNFKN